MTGQHSPDPAPASIGSIDGLPSVGVPPAVGAPPSVGVLIPIKAFDLAKTRLADAVGPAERAAMARRMAHTVLKAANGLATYVVTDDAGVAQWGRNHGAVIIVPDRSGLNYAVTFALRQLESWGISRVIIAHGDLPLARDLTPLARPSADIVIVTDHHGSGTNVMSMPVDTNFTFGYGPDSAHHHERQAKRLGYRTAVVTDDQLSWDVDTPEDLARLDIDHA